MSEFKGDKAHTSSKHARAQRWFPLPSKCDECDAVPVDRHHKDGDDGNNIIENIAFLCRRCHMIVDGRLERLKTGPKAPVIPPQPCVNCSRPSKPLRRGRCHRCSGYYRYAGKERPINFRGRV